MPLKSNLPSLVPTADRLKQTIALISGGYSLKPEIPDGRITVYPWDSEISDWFVAKSQENSASLSALVVQKLTRLPMKLMDRFVASELLLVMLVARGLSASGRVTYQARCPHCRMVQSPTSLQLPGEGLKILGQKGPDYPGYDVFILPGSKDEIKFRPLLVADLEKIAESRPETLSENGANLAASIVEVNNTKPDKLSELFEYYLALPPEDTDCLRQKGQELSPSLDTVVPHVCDSSKCGEKFHYNLALHYDFFIGPQRPTSSTAGGSSGQLVATAPASPST